MNQVREIATWTTNRGIKISVLVSEHDLVDMDEGEPGIVMLHGIEHDFIAVIKPEMYAQILEHDNEKTFLLAVNQLALVLAQEDGPSIDK